MLSYLAASRRHSFYTLILVLLFSAKIIAASSEMKPSDLSHKWLLNSDTAHFGSCYDTLNIQYIESTKSPSFIYEFTDRNGMIREGYVMGNDFHDRLRYATSFVNGVLTTKRYKRRPGTNSYPIFDGAQSFEMFIDESHSPITLVQIIRDKNLNVTSSCEFKILEPR